MSHLKTYPEYKDSGVEWIGQIPEQWEVKKYKRTFTFINGHGFPHNLQGDKKGDKPFLKVSDISFKGKYVKKSSNYVSDLTIKLNKWNEIEPYSILTAKIGEALRKNHRKINIVPCIIDNNMMGLTPSIEDNLDYLYYVLNVVDLDWYSNPGAVPSVNNRHFREDFLMIPSYQEQIKISHYLIGKTSEIDNLISDKERLIELLEEKRQAVITETVTKGLDPNIEMKDSGIEWVGKIPEHWAVKKLKYLSILNPSKSEISNNKNIKTTFIPMENLKSTGEVDYSLIREVADVYSSYTYFKEKDIIMAKVTPCFENGNIAIVTDLVNGIGFGTTELHVLRAKDNIETNFLYYILQSEWFKQEGISSMYGVAGLKRIPTRFINDFKIGLPNLDEQKKIINYILKINKQINDLMQTQRKTIIKLKEYRESLIYEAVTGKIDVRDYAVKQEEVY